MLSIVHSHLGWFLAEVAGVFRWVYLSSVCGKALISDPKDVSVEATEGGSIGMAVMRM